jgi:kinetochore protein Mis13/DSN1
VSSFRPQILLPNRGSNSRPIATIDDSEVEHDIRAMEDETDHLRRNSRAHTTSLHSTNSALQFGSNATPKLKRNKELRKSFNGLRKSSSGRGKRISSSFEATGVLCEFIFYLMRACSAETFIR